MALLTADQYLQGLFLTMSKMEILVDLFYKMIFECPFDYLMEQIWRKKHVYICTREPMCEWLQISISTYKNRRNTKYLR
jgi:hypothetical protein